MLNVIGFDFHVMREVVFSTLMCIEKIDVHSFVEKFLMLNVHLFEDGGVPFNENDGQGGHAVKAFRMTESIKYQSSVRQ